MKRDILRIGVGTKNPTKIRGIKKALNAVNKATQVIGPYDIVSCAVSSGVSEQPKSLVETMQGSMNRARNAHLGQHISIGIESGLMEVPQAMTGYVDVVACAIFNGEGYATGWSPGFECPPVVVQRVMALGEDLDAAFFKAGLTEEKRLGYGKGIINKLSGGLVSREQLVEWAVRMACIQIISANLYGFFLHDD